MTPVAVRWSPPPCWEVALREAGFRPVSRSGSWRHRGVVFAPAESWSLLSLPARAAAAAAAPGVLGSPGLWRVVGAASGRRRVFELPNGLLADVAEDDDASRPRTGLIGSCLRWGLQSASGGAPGDWRPPAREVLEGWLPSRRLLVQAGPVVRQGEWVCASGQLALRVALVPRLRADLSASRRRWLEVLLRRAAERWRLVRLGVVSADSGTSVVAEVNFTGAPAPVIERLLSVSWACLRGLTLWLAESASLLGENSLDLEVLDLAEPPTNEEPNNERTDV